MATHKFEILRQKLKEKNSQYIAMTDEELDQGENEIDDIHDNTRDACTDGEATVR